jgi:hypothetical protein
MINRANFTEIDVTNTVIRVVTVDADEILKNGGDQSFGAETYMINNFRLSSPLNKWVQSSIDGSFRKQPASTGDIFDSINNVFIKPRPFISWNLNDNFDWESPIPYPTILDNVNDIRFVITWDEENQEWKSYCVEEEQIIEYRWNKDTLNWVKK